MVDLEALARECGVQLYDVETVSENGRTIYWMTASGYRGCFRRFLMWSRRLRENGRWRLALPGLSAS